MGIGKPGPPAKYDEEWAILERDRKMLLMRRQGMLHHEIATELGVGRSTVSERLKKLAQDILSSAGAMEVAIVEAERLEEAESRFFNKRIAPEDQPDFCPTTRDVEAWLKLSESRRKLHGADAAQKHEWRFDQDGETAGDRRAEAANRFMDLADKIANGGIGSGRAPVDAEDDDDIIDVEVIEERVVDDEDA